MITLTAIVHSVESLHSFPSLGQNLRRHYEHTSFQGHQSG